jgi:hypothetical protein
MLKTTFMFPCMLDMIRTNASLKDINPTRPKRNPPPSSPGRNTMMKASFFLSSSRTLRSSSSHHQGFTSSHKVAELLGNVLPKHHRLLSMSDELCARGRRTRIDPSTLRMSVCVHHLPFFLSIYIMHSKQDGVFRLRYLHQIRSTEVSSSHTTRLGREELWPYKE